MLSIEHRLIRIEEKLDALLEALASDDDPEPVDLEGNPVPRPRNEDAEL